MSLENCPHCAKGFRTGGKNRRQNTKEFRTHVAECEGHPCPEFAHRLAEKQEEEEERKEAFCKRLTDAGFNQYHAEVLLEAIEFWNRSEE